MSNARQKRKTRRAPSRDSIILIFVAGAFLLAAPLVTVISMGGPCALGLSEGACFSSMPSKELVGLLPYVMLVGAVLIAYNLKRISDSLLPNEEDDE